MEFAEYATVAPVAMTSAAVTLLGWASEGRRATQYIAPAYGARVANLAVSRTELRVALWLREAITGAAVVKVGKAVVRERQS